MVHPSPPSSPTGTQPIAPTTPTLSPTTEPSASPATPATPGDSATEESTTASDASPQTEIAVETPETPASGTVPAGSSPASGDSLIAGERAPAELFAVALRFENDPRYDVDPSSANSIFAAATDESGGFIDIDSPTAAETESDSEPDTEPGSQNSAATRQALKELAKREQPGDSRRRILGSATEGGFIELAATDPSDAARRHPLLDDQTRRDRSSETDASIGRLIAFDSAGSEAWNEVVGNYSLADDAASSDRAIMDAPQPVAASNIVAVAFGAGVMLTSSHMTRHRWKSLVVRLLQQARQIVSRLLNWN